MIKNTNLIYMSDMIKQLSRIQAVKLAVFCIEDWSDFEEQSLSELKSKYIEKANIYVKENRIEKVIEFNDSEMNPESETFYNSYIATIQLECVIHHNYFKFLNSIMHLTFDHFYERNENKRNYYCKILKTMLSKTDLKVDVKIDLSDPVDVMVFLDYLQEKNENIIKIKKDKFMLNLPYKIPAKSIKELAEKISEDKGSKFCLENLYF